MRLECVLPWICAAAVVLGACSPGDSGDHARQEATPTPGTASDRSDRQHHPQQKPDPVSVRVAPDLPAATHETVRAFLTFAADPSPSSAARVPFTSPLVLRVNDEGRRLQSKDVRQSSAWFVSDGEGTTSALFVISNSIANSQGGEVQFLASTRQIPVCNLDQDRDEDMPNEFVYVTLEPRGGCADGFRLRLDLDPSATIRAVELAVRAP